MHKSIASGYMLLSCTTPFGYRGVDRMHFEPSLIELNQNTCGQFEGNESKCIWRFVKDEWRREAYKIFEDNRIKYIPDILDIFLIKDYEVAQLLQKMILPHIGRYEVVYCSIFPLVSDVCNITIKYSLLGYDVAYLGGDYYSAILNGMFINENKLLTMRYKSRLNEYCLFNNVPLTIDYFHEFLQAAKSESIDNYAIYLIETP